MTVAVPDRIASSDSSRLSLRIDPSSECQLCTHSTCNEVTRIRIRHLHLANLIFSSNKKGSTRSRNEVNCENTIVRSPLPWSLISRRTFIKVRILALCGCTGVPDMRSVHSAHRTPLAMLLVSGRFLRVDCHIAVPSRYAVRMC